MTTAEQFGFIKPIGTDLISLGDNAISTNADITAKLANVHGPYDLKPFWEGAGTAAGTINLYRTGGIAQLVIYNVPVTTTASIKLASGVIPVGYRPPINILYSNVIYGENPPQHTERVIQYANGALSIFDASVGNTIYGSWSWPCNENWPTV